MTTIIGVDFSGGSENRDRDVRTCVAQGSLTNAGALLLDSVQPTRRSDLCNKLLTDIAPPAVVAMDFPFGVPRHFGVHLAPGNPQRTMRDLWHTVADLTLLRFYAARCLFVDDHDERKRTGDAKYFSESFSPLHWTQPDMIPMTYHGTRMLHYLERKCPGRWHVPPLRSDESAGESITLLETMPGALLKALGFEYKVYKGYKRGQHAQAKRETILDNICRKSGISLPNLDKVREDCLANDDCLDSVIAAVGAAMWAQVPAQFRHPQPYELDDAQLEGWIYVPLPAPAN